MTLSTEQTASELNRSTTPITVRIPEACRLTGIGRSKLYELINAGDIEIIKVGSITLVPMASLAKFLNELRQSNPTRL